MPSDFVELNYSEQDWPETKALGDFINVTMSVKDLSPKLIIDYDERNYTSWVPIKFFSEAIANQLTNHNSQFSYR